MPERARIALHPGVASHLVSHGDPLLSSADYAVVDLVDYSDALRLMKRGYGLARLGFTQKGAKWVTSVSRPGQLSHLELVYHASYPNSFAGLSTPWSPDRCSQYEEDWFVHPFAPVPHAHP
jgi:hypothetical protein